MTKVTSLLWSKHDTQRLIVGLKSGHIALVQVSGQFNIQAQITNYLEFHRPSDMGQSPSMIYNSILYLQEQGRQLVSVSEEEVLVVWQLQSDKV